jgi:hypothetical protein
MIPEVLPGGGSESRISARSKRRHYRLQGRVGLLSRSFSSSVDTGLVIFPTRISKSDENISGLAFIRQSLMMIYMREPSLLVPYPGPDPSGRTIDVYVYLRPETNGVLTESVIMKTIVSDMRWKNGVKLVYLANYPGDFIQTRHVIEHHYRVKIAFARHGGDIFTPGMRREFEKKFQSPFNPDLVLGAFDALKATGLNEEEMFAYRVDDEDMLVSLGQNIKRRDDIWIVNYDIPAILHRNTFKTDIAVMVFRVALPWGDFEELVELMTDHLIAAEILDAQTAPSRAFHHSKSPWEQLLDGIDFLWGVDISDGGAEDDISFGAYLMSKGYRREDFADVIRCPLVVYRDDDGALKEGNMFNMSAGMNYQGAEHLWRRVDHALELPDD